VRARSVETTSTCQVGGNGLCEIILPDTWNMIIDTWYDNGHVALRYMGNPSSCTSELYVRMTIRILASDGDGRRLFSEVQLTGAVQRHAIDRALRFGT
jgi:hypothetical protein